MDGIIVLAQSRFNYPIERNTKNLINANGMHTFNSTNDSCKSIKHPRMCVRVCIRITGNVKAQNCQFLLISTVGNTLCL